MPDCIGIAQDLAFCYGCYGIPLYNCFYNQFYLFTVEELFKKAQSMLNATRSNKAEAFKLITAAATLGHREARSMLAWAQLLGTQTGLPSANQDIPAAFQTFKELVETGLPSAHMVRFL